MTLYYSNCITFIPQPILNLIRSYIDNRRIVIAIKESKFETHYVDAGVPRGSILGSTLFNIFINDIPTTSSTHLAVYADTAVYASSWIKPLNIYKRT